MRVTIVGVGLIGGSLGAALRRVRGKSGTRKYRVIGVDRSPRALAAAKRKGAVDDSAARPEGPALDADILILAAPPLACSALLKKIQPLMPPQALISDVASVKTVLAGAAGRHAAGALFIGAHPLAGSEKSGIENAGADLFRGAACALTPPPASPGVGRRKRLLWNLWKDAGARPFWITAQAHDELAAWTSHFPHVLAAAYCHCLRALGPKRALARSVAGSAFRDFTRIAGSEPALWSEICRLNRGHLKKVEKQFSASLALFLRKDFPAALFRLARGERTRLLSVRGRR